MADLVMKYERIATESAPPPPSRSTPKRTMSLVGSGESPRPPSSTPAVVSHLPSTASLEKSPPQCSGCVSGDCPSCFWYDQLLSTVKSRENSNKRKRFLGSEAENLKIETEDKTCADGNLRRDALASLDACRRPEMQPRPASDADAAEVKSRCAAEIEAYLSAMEKGQQRRFAEKYNYDVVNDVPLEGRYEWIPLSVGAVEETLK
ncbi:cyclin-dependent kinase inhibitor 7-like [Rhodamnia argentea]|uniref:Cyclin-dependent kinase inhibitor 7-like n=1 Tax=Rhodamnia argentea TaxID=178133 RepID=A0A8B8NMF4_9MYRT|nr:cyclin-dependent kinase inhibitor 7-like [Rhodamnia argentea]